jgi:Flp pilus assembly protein TadG
MNRLLRAKRGAIYVEFLIAFLPLFVFFMCLLQMAGLHLGKLATLHAAETAARAAIVVLPDDPAQYDNVQVGRIDGKRKDAIIKAASIPLSAVRSLVGVQVTFPSSAGADDDRSQVSRSELVRVKVSAIYRCTMPMAKYIVCDPLTATRKLTAEAALPNQGADYSYE